ncbi:signal peptidase I [Haloarchaeobius iranensis]|uniref:Signal peptidase I n=1 Tax=Haloarchaeobius iranensis TaxID=996166 RepID=A0A1G9TT47_9EURY|nr:signal peptidase I [Haloarchaeobius iranensis]SDM50728.1 signal peptidase I [Haloarchaeobius iranensis]
MSPESTRGTALRAVGVLLVLALVVPFVVFAVPQVVGADASFVVISGSMEPAISVGDAVVVAAVDGDEVRVGDVITYVTADRAAPTTHRVIEIQQTAAGPEFVTQGDNNEDPDASTVTPDRLVGRVLLTIPFIGYVVEFVGTTTGFALLVATPIALLVVTELWSLYRRRTGNDEAESVASGAASDGTASAAAVATDDEQPAGWSIGVRDLTVTMAVVGVAAVYSGVVAYLVYDGSVTYLRLLQLSVAAFAAFAVGFLVLLGMRVFVSPSSDTAAAGGTLRGSLDETTRSLPTVTVASVAELRGMATAAERWLVHDEEHDRLSYSDGTMLYVCEVPDDGEDPAIATADEPVTGELTATDDSVLDDDATGGPVVDDAVATEEAAWAALFGDAFEHENGEFTFPTRDARPDGGEDGEQ